MKVLFSPRATRDLHSISDYIRAENPAAASRVRAAIYRALRTIESHPEAGRLLLDGVRRCPIGRYPYLIFYEVDAERQTIGIITIRHGAREPYLV